MSQTKTPEALVPDAGRALAARLAGIEDAAGASPIAWIEDLTARLPFPLTMAIVEHAFGVVPLVEEVFDVPLEAVRRGDELAALGLFTPNAELSWSAAALAAERRGDEVLLSGEVRIPSPRAGTVLVLARLAGEGDRLALVDARNGANDDAAYRGPCWLAFDGTAVGRERTSRPLAPARQGAPPESCRRLLDDYAGVYALAASLYAVRGIRAVRRAARTTVRGPTPLNRSQVVAMGITEVEIETDLAAAAARTRWETEDGASRGSGIVVAAAAARALAQVVAKTRELTGKAGLECDGPFADEDAARLVDVFLGGQLMVESELAASIGL